MQTPLVSNIMTVSIPEEQQISVIAHDIVSKSDDLQQDSPVIVDEDVDLEEIQTIVNDEESPLGNYIKENNIKISFKELKRLRLVAKQLYDRTYVLVDTVDYLRYLGSGSAQNSLKTESDTEISIIRYFYMSLFRWNLNLLSSLRALCERLYFKGESQDIDRILDCFSESWFHVYGNIHQDKSYSLFGSVNGVFLISYSLILLNTDLHTAELEKKKKINKGNYVKNASSALTQNHIKISSPQRLLTELKSFYDDLSQKELPIHLANQETKLPSRQNLQSSKANNPLSSLMHARNQYMASHISTSPQVDRSNPATPKKPAVYGFTNALANEKKLKRIASVESRLSSATRHSIISKSSAFTNDSMIQRYDHSIYTNITAGDDILSSDFIVEEEGELQLELEGPPWIKEGLVSVLIPESVLAELQDNSDLASFGDSNKKTGIASSFSGFFGKRYKPKWQSLFTVVSKNELKIFDLDSMSSSSNAKDTGEGNWFERANCIATINLCSCFAQVSSPKSKIVRNAESSYGKPYGYSSIKKSTGYETYWYLNLPSTRSIKVSTTNRILFYSGSLEVAKEFADSCNFWSARSSAIPPEELISSIDFGWSDKLVSILNDPQNNPESELTSYLSSKTISKWTPVSYGLIPSTWSMSEQLVQLQKHHKKLQMKLDEHRRLADHEQTFAKVYQHSHSSSSSGSFGIFSRKSNQSLSISKNTKMIRLNFANKNNYLENELLRFNKYIAILQRAIEMRKAVLLQQNDDTIYED